MAQAGESRSPRSPISPDGKAPRGRDAMVQLVMALDEDSGCPGERLIRTTSALLKTHLEKWEKERGSACRPEDCAMTPLEFFCHVQAKNAASEISVRITEMNLTYLHIRELLQNLFALVTFIRPKSVESAHFFCNNYIQVLVPIVQDIENKLAQFDKAPPIDWDAAVKRLNSYERQYHTAIETAVACTRTTSGVKRRDPNRESDDIPFNYYVPLLNDFDVGKILGRGSFGAVYEAL
ncbi:uncharacterized protein LOC111247194 isoform X2 [Varroa destructor]|uniref:Uncharacterized protein n=1 Tax=Varroa destructor TaxID=109461 RepID=A0A7M7JMP3_VARDE|nr:uncharacterized protein LOC111247194 isoform X2 [Varroa destructor]